MKGRPPIAIDVVLVQELLELGVPKARVARQLKISRATLYRILERIKEQSNG